MSLILPDRLGVIDRPPLTQMVHNITLAPLRSMRTRAFTLVQHASSKEKVVNGVRSQFLECLLHKKLYTAQAQEIKRENGDGVLGGVISQIIEGSLDLFHATDTQDKVAGLFSLLQQLLDALESL